jgi:type II secretory pathway predicted ATPase ExeA
MKEESAVGFFKWSENPFTFRILSDFFVGYDDEKDTAIQSIKNGEKFLLILGPTGSGKTTFLRYLSSVLKDKDVVYLPKPPKEPEELIGIFKHIWKPRLSLFRREGSVDLFSLSDKLNDKVRDGLVVFVDECHEAPIGSLEWLRVIADQTDNLILVMAGLPVFEQILKENLETLMKRVTKTIKLSNLTKYETRELIKRRVEGMGGEDIKPFTAEIVDYIYEKTGGFPREILRECNELVSMAFQKNVSTIDYNFVRESSHQERIPLESVTVLPERQRTILNILSEKGNLTPSEIVSYMEPDEYKSKDNAIRSVNNLLRRLMAEGLAERQRIGKSYKYRVSGKFQSLMVSR